MNLKWIMMVLFLIAVAFELLTRILMKRSVNRPIPESVSDVYDGETYSKWLRYAEEKSKLSTVRHIISSVLSFLLLILNGYAFAARPFQNDYSAAFIVLLVSLLVSLVVEIPTEYYDTMSIEERYGFDHSTKKTFWMDQLKNLLINAAINFGIVSLFILLHQKLGDGVLILFAVLLFVIILFISFISPILMKVFNKFTPMEDSELKTRLKELLEGHGYQVRDIQIMDASRRTTKSNAFFTGFGKMKTIVLYDNLVNAFTDDEICAVFAHEMGHGLHKDTLKNQIMSFAQMLILGTLAWLTLRTEGIFTAFGFTGINYGFASILILSVEFAVVAPLFGLVISAISRRAEYRADRQAVEEGYADSLVSALKELARQNFSDLAPSPVIVKLEYSHPTLSQRIDAIYNQVGRNKK